MFLAMSLHADPSTARTNMAAELHAAHLAQSGRFGALEQRGFEGGTAYWDAGSSHALLAEHPDRSIFLLRGGYVAGADEWRGGQHSTEDLAGWGEFAAARVEQTAEDTHVQVWADAAGSWPLYYGFTPQQIVVSNDPHFVAIALGFTQLSAQGAYELLAYHHALGEETTIRGVYALGAGRRLLAQTSAHGPRGFTRETFAAHGYTAPASSEDAVYEALRDSLATIPALTDDRRTVTLQISGGLDSRLTLGAYADALPNRPEAITLDLSTEKELDVARQVTSTLGFPHRIASLHDVTIEAARAGWALTGGQVAVHAAAGNILSYDVADAGPDGDITLVGAWPGDCLIGSYVPFSSTMLSPLLRGWVLDDWARKRAPLWKSRGVSVSGTAARRIARRAHAALRRSLLRSPGRTAAQAISNWAMFERQPRFSYVSPAILSHNVLAVTPVLAGPYLRGLLSLTASDIVSKNFYRRMIRRRLESLRHIPNANTGLPVTDAVELPPRFPRGRPEIFALLPAGVQSLIRRMRPANHYIGRAAPTAETDFWQDLFRTEGVTAHVELDGVVVDARASDDLHVGAVALALTWSQQYLTAVADELRDAR